MNGQIALLSSRLDWRRMQVRARNGFADGGGVGGVVLSLLAREPVRRAELGRDQPHGVAVGLEQPCPVVGASAGFQADGAGQQVGDELVQLAAGHLRAHQFGLAGVVDAVDGRDVLGEIVADEYDSYGLPLLGRVDESSHFPSWHLGAGCGNAAGSGRRRPFHSLSRVGQRMRKCGVCGRALDQVNEPMSIGCGGDCWGCVGELEAEMGDEESRSRVVSEMIDGLRPLPTKEGYWPFDQARDVAAISTKQVLQEQALITTVVHYAEDHSWAFACGSTANPEDARLVSMRQVIERDPTLLEVADLPPGWRATRDALGGAWMRCEGTDAESGDA
jgi:hypothetical protein